MMYLGFQTRVINFVNVHLSINLSETKSLNKMYSNIENTLSYYYFRGHV